MGTRTEIKNVNSFRFVEKAIHHEFQRQADILEEGGKITQETRLYDADRDETRSMRSKEVANDYRYFPEPDLLPVVIDDALYRFNSRISAGIACRQTVSIYRTIWLGAYDANVLSDSRPLADYFEAVVEECGDAKIAANWVQGELLGQLNRSESTIEKCPVSATALGQLISRILDNTISGKMAKQVLESMWKGEGNADEIIEAHGLRQVSDTGCD